MKNLTRSFVSPLPWGECPNCATKFSIPKEDIIERTEKDWEEYGSPCGSFSVNTICRKCSKLIMVSGTWSIEPDQFIDEKGDYDVSYYQLYQVRFCDPAPKLISIPNSTPASVHNELKESFRGYWLSNEFAAISIRKALERMCDALHIPQNKLHTRLLFICSKDFQNGIFSDLADIAIAAKWLGNAGAHESGEITNQYIGFIFEAAETIISRISKCDTLHSRAKAIREKFESDQQSKE
jgi:hypothetical protein